MSDVVVPMSRPLRLGEQEVRAVVVDVDEPRGLMMAKVRVLGQWSDAKERDLPWAEYRLPVGHGFNRGDFTPAEVGDLVWVDFIGRDTRYPRITGSCHFSPDGVPNFPHEAFKGAEKY
ncbi:MAG: phage baseplate assembly protein V, partial [Endozoicomonas sp.]